ncbi:NAD(P)-dependent alcohol dehydrogenase [Thermocatellispora tengchongensis]|uniref:NAD(P)-dependent alcohol dehydrogenase n=1 Tax=Thermocatellispora tengchongensis TaxID=1073253 RepID=UPI0036310799
MWHLLTGLPYPVRLAGYGLFRPKTPVLGRDLAGIVDAVGAGVTRFRPGDEVFGACDGSFAEYARGGEDAFAPKPANLTFEQAAAVPTSACAALHGLRDAGGVRAGQKALVTGAGGGVGGFAVQLARSFGAHVTGVCRGTKADLVRSLGAQDVIDHTREDVTDRPHRYDLILDTAGNRPLSLLRRALTPTGTLVIVGGVRKGRWLQGSDRQVRAMLLSRFTRQTLRGLMSAGRAEDLRFLTGLIEAGEVTPVIDRAYPLDRLPEALEYLRAGHATGKVVILP